MRPGSAGAAQQLAQSHQPLAAPPVLWRKTELLRWPPLCAFCSTQHRPGPLLSGWLARPRLHGARWHLESRSRWAVFGENLSGVPEAGASHQPPLDAACCWERHTKPDDSCPLPGAAMTPSGPGCHGRSWEGPPSLWVLWFAVRVRTTGDCCNDAHGSREPERPVSGPPPRYDAKAEINR